MCLDFCRPIREHTTHELMTISTPLVYDVWADILATHPDQAFAHYICHGLQHGFRIGFQHGSPLKSTTRNMQSALDHLKFVSEQPKKELSLGRMISLLPDNHTPPLHINGVGVIPKGHNISLLQTSRSHVMKVLTTG